ncbi:acyl-CoA synthetase [Halieaceae bacterium IMCC14734]|uniref:Acyl-CoA synthetase n=1 Tax=Candidatus Litorirhabdus singularis TaxID=2518993 RepID=A0ABT3TIR4_9GAMM|nr:AMP-binding protein [Candidatus Litorirhabdus singularis]MCX2982227.1 acyl-CoA synthetase [Candidatus Litorirhabdus singularis]
MSDSIHHPPLMADLLINGLNRYDDEPCLYLGDKVASYRDVRESTSQMVQALQSSGLSQGRKIAVISANRPEVLSNIAAMQLAGCIGSPLHPMGSLDDHSYVIEHAEIDALVFDTTVFSPRAEELKQRFPDLILLGFGPNDVGADYLALAASFEPQPLVAPDVDPTDISSITYTGGTTGKPKGVLSTYRATSYMTMIQMAEWEFPADLRMLIATPLSHAAAAFFVPVLQKGGAFYVMQGFSPDEFFDMVETHRITATMLVPVMLYFLLDSPRSAQADMSSMETIFYGASAMSPARLTEGINKWGKVFYQFFGQSEAPMVLANMKKSEHDLSKPERLSSCGRPAPWIHLALLDDNGNAVAAGEPGEICVRAPLVMHGYKDMPEQTEEAMAGGWLHTGDVGRLDSEGFLYIVDRKKDMVVSGGFNVFPREVEDVLSGHEAVGQVAVIGVPDEKWGEAVKAVVVLKPGFESSEELTQALIDMVKAAKGSVQAPKSIDYADAIPLTAVGKPDKKTLRAAYWSDSSRGVG